MRMRMAQPEKARPRHIPLRTCIGCRMVKAKQGLIRLVATPDGGMAIDTAGRRPGRGAYLCPDRECWQAALKRNRLEYALRGKLSSEGLRQLVEYAQGLPGRE